jgi:hypothetical protein
MMIPMITPSRLGRALDPQWTGGSVLHQPPWSFGFDSQTTERDQGKQAAPSCLKINYKFDLEDVSKCFGPILPQVVLAPYNCCEPQ